MDVEDKHVFFDKLAFFYLEMPKFNKTEEQLENMFDKWLFVLRNLSRLMERPAALQERVFTRLFEQAEIASYTAEEQREYEDSIKAYRDINNAINTARKEAKEEGRAEGLEQGMAKGRAEGLEQGMNQMALHIAQKMKADGRTAEEIARYSGLSITDIEQL